MIDERHKHIGVLLDVMGDFNNLSSELSAEPPCYSEIFECIDEMIKTLNSAMAHLTNVEKELANVKDTDSDANADPS